MIFAQACPCNLSYKVVRIDRVFAKINSKVVFRHYVWLFVESLLLGVC